MVDLYAISIDDVRDMFGADKQLAAELTQAARAAFPQPKHHRRGFLPLRRRGPELTVDPTRPTQSDLTALLAGGYIPPERMAASWRLFHALLTHRAAAHARVEASAEEFDAAEFDLSCKGLDSFYSLRRLGERQLAVPVHGGPDSLNGYAKHVHVVETLAALQAVSPLVEDSTRVVVEPVVEVCTVAAERGLDVVLLTTKSHPDDTRG